MQIPAITFDEILKDRCPGVRVGALLIKVKVAPAGELLLKEIEERLSELSTRLAVEEISSIPSVKSFRQAYKTLGKDPSRYRPSAEALLRRVVKGKGLYQVNNVVDALNLASVETGYSIGGFDFGSIDGSIQAGRGADEEPYEAIGRGALNIEGLPVLRDQSGAFGTPTSDATRTMVTTETTTFLALVFDFDNREDLASLLELLESLLVKHAAGELIAKTIVGP